MQITSETKANGVRGGNVRAISGEEKQTIGADGTVLPESLKDEAISVIHDAWRNYAGKGGILDLQERVAEKTRGIAGKIKSLADQSVVAAFDRGGQLDREARMKLAVSIFDSALTLAANTLRAEVEGDEAKKERADLFIKSTWRQLASNLRSGMRAGFDPRESESEIAFRTKAADARKATRSQSETSAAGGASAEAKEMAQAAVVVSKDSPKIAAALNNLLKAVKNADVEEYEDKIFNILNNATVSITALQSKDGGGQLKQA